MLDTSPRAVRLSTSMSSVHLFATYLGTRRMVASFAADATPAIRLRDRKLVAAASINALTTEGASTDG
jgi:hypothetical protein